MNPSPHTPPPMHNYLHNQHVSYPVPQPHINEDFHDFARMQPQPQFTPMQAAEPFFSQQPMDFSPMLPDPSLSTSFARSAGSSLASPISRSSVHWENVVGEVEPVRFLFNLSYLPSEQIILDHLLATSLYQQEWVQMYSWYPRSPRRRPR
jgi:hypothetical protein